MNEPSITCPACTCLCDDIEVVAQQDGLKIVNTCDRGKVWFEQNIARAHQAAKHFVDGKPCLLESAIDAAAGLLRDAKAPLVCGLDGFAVVAQQEAWKLAEAIGGTIDTSLHNHARASVYSLQKHGKVTATFGEIASRSDLIMFWFCDPMTTHPRLVDRLRHEGKRIVVVNEQETAISKVAEQFIQLPKKLAASALMMMDSTILEKEFSPASNELDQEVWAQLAQEMASSRYGAIIYGHTTRDSQFDLANDRLAMLVRGLNLKTRFVALSLRTDGNAQSAENMLAWSSGYPFAINYTGSMPWFNGNEYSAQCVLARGECDAVLLGPVQTEGLQALSAIARKCLNEVPVIELTTSAGVVDGAAVKIQIAIPGIDDSGDFCRLDDVALPLTKIVASDRPAATTVLDSIRARV